MDYLSNQRYKCNSRAMIKIMNSHLSQKLSKDALKTVNQKYNIKKWLNLT